MCLTAVRPNISCSGAWNYLMFRSQFSSKTHKCSHPSGYAASRIRSSMGAEKGTGTPCNIGSACIASRRLGKSVGNIIFRADPKVCTSPTFPLVKGASLELNLLRLRFAVMGWTIDCTTLKDPTDSSVEGPDGMYTRRGTWRRGEGGFKSFVLMALKLAKSSSISYQPNACFCAEHIIHYLAPHSIAEWSALSIRT